MIFAAWFNVFAFLLNAGVLVFFPSDLWPITVCMACVSALVALWCFSEAT